MANFSCWLQWSTEKQITIAGCDLESEILDVRWLRLQMHSSEWNEVLDYCRWLRLQIPFHGNLSSAKLNKDVTNPGFIRRQNKTTELALVLCSLFTVNYDYNL